MCAKTLECFILSNGKDNHHCHIGTKSCNKIECGLPLVNITELWRPSYDDIDSFPLSSLPILLPFSRFWLFSVPKFFFLHIVSYTVSTPNQAELTNNGDFPALCDSQKAAKCLRSSLHLFSVVAKSGLFFHVNI